MKRAQILFQGQRLWGVLTSDEQQIVLPDQRRVSVDQAIWLPPVSPGAAVYALGLNYADHSRELGFKKPTEPLVFLKGQHTFVAHRGTTSRPLDANQMHPECELVAVIGKPASKVKRAEALNYVAGYTIANDYAIREYLENYYRPNLRVKNRDGTTPLGPWIIDAQDVGDPQALQLQTFINGKPVQNGSTSEMVFDIATLVEYLSSFTTLLPGDLILTGTPHGVAFVQGGDEVVCEIEKIGRLINRIESSS